MKLSIALDPALFIHITIQTILYPHLSVQNLSLFSLIRLLFRFLGPCWSSILLLSLIHLILRYRAQQAMYLIII